MRSLKKFLRENYRIKGFEKDVSEKDLDEVINDLRNFEKVIIHDVIHMYDDFLKLKPDAKSYIKPEQEVSTDDASISDITRTIGYEPEYKIGISCSVPSSPAPRIMNVTAQKMKNSRIAIKKLYFNQDFISNNGRYDDKENELNHKDLITRLRVGAVYLAELSNLYSSLDYDCRLIRKKRLECAIQVRDNVRKTFYFKHIYTINKNIRHILTRVEERIERPDDTIFNPS